MVKQPPAPLPVLGAATDAREDLCRRCGVSCHFAVPVNGLPVVIDELRCRYLLRAEDGRFACSVYPQRYQVAPWCHSAEDALLKGLQAQDCPYGRGAPSADPAAPRVRGKTRLSPSLLHKVLPAILAEIQRVGVPSGADPAPVQALLERSTPADEAPVRWTYALSEDGQRYLFHRA